MLSQKIGFLRWRPEHNELVQKCVKLPLFLHHPQKAQNQNFPIISLIDTTILSGSLECLNSSLALAAGVMGI